jgi:PAS domain S-box-containing protein
MSHAPPKLTGTLPTTQSSVPPVLVSDSTFRLMVEAVADYAIFLLDPGGHIQTWNNGARIIKGYVAEEVLGRHFSMFYPEELILQRWPEHELEVAREVGRFEDENWRVRKDGTRFWANIVITRLIEADGTLRGYSKITRDLTDRRQQEERLRVSEERFRLLVDGVQDYAIFMLDPSGHVVSWNGGAQKTKGYQAAEILGKHFSVFYPEDVVASGWPAEELRLALRDGRFEDEGWRLRKDGSRFWANVIITPLHGARGEHRGFAKVTRDMTDKRRISMLEDESRRITTFLAMLGHELRNPLAPISNALSIIELVETQSEPIQAARAVIARQLKQMTRLVDDLLDVGRISSGKIHLESKPVRVRDAVMDAIEAAEPLIAIKSQLLGVALADAELWILGDRARIIQVVGNLLTNAVKFTPDGGRINVALRHNGDRIEIAVSDSGVGIPAHLLDEIFHPFVQGDQDSARSQGGLGLGLSLVRQIVALHRGTVVAKSPGERGKGSEFVVSLPAAAAPSEISSKDESAELAPSRRVLVVDDNQDAADTLHMVLEAMGYQVTVAYDGPAAIEAIKDTRPEIVLLDIGLPGLSGIEVAQRVRAEMVDPPLLVAVTGYSQEEDREAAFKAGFHSHLSKPLDIAALSGMLKRMLA